MVVLIAGAGIGGLATALALSRRGIASQVLERRSAFAEEGAGIQIGPNGTRILAELGVADLLRPQVAVPDAIRVMDGGSGRELVSLPLGQWILARHDSPYWVAHRADLHAALLRRVLDDPLIRLSMAAEVVAMRDDDDHVAVRSKTGGKWTGHVLIVADGMWSALRTSFFDPAEPKFFGKSAVRCVVPWDAVPEGLKRNETQLWLRPDGHVVHYPVRAGHEMALVAIFDDDDPSEDWGAEATPISVAARAGAFPRELRDLIETPRAWRKWSLYQRPISQHWARERVALLGDAAHPLLPFLAQGAVMALEDAVVLAECLADKTMNIPLALQRYQRRRQARVTRVARASLRNGKIYHMSGAMALARNAAFVAVPSQALMSAYDWLYGWRALQDSDGMSVSA